MVDRERRTCTWAAVLGALLLALALASCAQPNSGIFGGSVVGLVSSTDGTCVNAGPTFFNGSKDEPTCFVRRVAHTGQCVKVSSHTPAANNRPPYRFPVDSSVTLPQDRYTSHTPTTG